TLTLAKIPDQSQTAHTHEWKTASKFCQFYNKRAFKFPEPTHYLVDIKYSIFLTGKFNAD
ncbi:MAG: hypothetical protein ACXV8I_13210, partial [Methylobacter sp.]